MTEPIHSQGFEYDGELYVVCEGGARYTRDSTQMIDRLVRPDPNDTLRDESADYFCAQLKFYNLPVPDRADQSAAKNLLLLALEQRKLEVPADLIKLEARMRIDWVAANWEKLGLSRGETRERSRAPSSMPVERVNRSSGVRFRHGIRGNSESVTINLRSGTRNGRSSKSSKRGRGGISRKELDSLAWSLPPPNTPPPSLPPGGATSRESLGEEDEPRLVKERNEPHDQEATGYVGVKRQPDYDFDN